MNDTEFMEAMLDDLATVAKFYDNPSLFLEGTQISPAMKSALLSDDLDALQELGMDRELASAALSGRHTTGGYCN